MIKELLEYDKRKLIDILWRCDPDIYQIFKTSHNLEESRNRLNDHLNEIEGHLFNIYSDKYFKNVNILERNNAKECLRILRNIIRTESEEISNFSALNVLYKIAHRKMDFNKFSKGFIFEFISLFKGINCNSGIYKESNRPRFIRLEGREAAIERMKSLDIYASNMEKFFDRYKTGLDRDLIEERRKNKRFIQNLYNIDGYDIDGSGIDGSGIDGSGIDGSGYDSEWNDYEWHLNHIVKDISAIQEIVELSDSEIRGLECAEDHNIPFQITLYYLSLFDRKNNNIYDNAIRAQVLPGENYCLSYKKSKESGSNLDYMDEKSTSPIKGITRRYPQILILKPINACSQICQYCQRNWEITDIKDAKFQKEIMEDAIEWTKDNKNIKEVLITGGDPLILEDKKLDWLLYKLSNIENIERIRIGTRMLVTLPQRITDDLITIFDKYNRLGERELCIMSHFEHPTEITPDTLQAIYKIKRAGISIYNQQVFTYYNSKKFETCLLRRMLKKSGIDPYYTFNTKGKDETIDYRVPIARLEQERKEESRLLPGLLRTDEPVFNVPRLGKSYVHSGHDHEVIMILIDGKRMYRFYPWESKYAQIEPYNYIDVSIYDYLKRLNNDGQDIDEYSSIWYYF